MAVLAHKKIKLSLISLALFSYCGFTLADEQVESLDTITVTSQQDEMSVKDKKVGETVKTSSLLKRQQVQDSRDLVRYETGVSVVETGRFGSSGYAIRGVDENRVAITVDGLHQAETLSSEGFKDLFEGYGNFNNTRNGVEIETLKQAQITKGANSIKTGSGSLGGSVVFETKDARDFLVDKNYHVSYKKGYNTADNQNLDTVTLAGKYKWFDALFIKTKRDGHELENFDYKKFDAQVQGRKREKADPYDKNLDSTLMKVSFQPNENHRFTAMADLYESRSKGADLSYTLNSTRLTDFGDSRKELEYRHNNDRVKRTNYAFSYENYSVTPFWDTLKVTYSEQKIATKARNEDYCDGNDECDKVKNPLGLKYNENNELVDQNGNPVNYTYSKTRETYLEYVTQEVFNEWKKKEIPPQDIISKYEEKGISKDKLPTTLYSCYKNPESNPDKCQITFGVDKVTETLNANNQIYDLTLSNNSNLINKQNTYSPLLLSCKGISCNTTEKDSDGDSTIAVFNKDGKPMRLGFKVDKQRDLAILKRSGRNTLTAHNLILPNSTGYNRNLWTDRSLNTHTKQINLDLTKYLELGSTQHNFSYGALLSETKKEMVNSSGDTPLNLKWWALYPDDCQKSSSTLCNKSNTFSFLIPVKMTTNALYFADDLKINNYLGFEVGYRYDRVKYKPHYIAGVTPKIPDDMVEGLAKNFIAPFTEKILPDLPAEPKQPREWDFKEYIPKYKFDEEGYNAAVEKYNEEKKAFDILKAERDKIILENAEIPKKNALARHQANVNVLAQNKKYSSHSYALGTNIDPTDYLRLQFKYSQGFRAPTSDEVYFTFKHPDFTVLPNLELKKETAKTKQVSFTLYKDFGFLTFSYFQTKYKNFIDLADKGERVINTGTSGGSITYPIHQNVNREHAKVNGFELDSRLNLGVLSKKLDEISLSYKLTYQRGKVKVTEELDGKDANGLKPTISFMAPMNAIQPMKSVYGLSYNHNSGKFGLDLYVTHSKAKEAKDTYNESWRAQRDKEITADPNNIGKKNVTKDSTKRWRSNSYTLVDVIAYAKPIENLTLQFGVYNLTNRKYITWDSARSIKQFGTSNRIDYVSGEGINRFYAPGRNFKLSAELTF